VVVLIDVAEVAAANDRAHDVVQQARRDRCSAIGRGEEPPARLEFGEPCLQRPLPALVQGGKAHRLGHGPRHDRSASQGDRVRPPRAAHCRR
jgi:hypothetical protein